jgi:hypothetical protein
MKALAVSTTKAGKGIRSLEKGVDQLQSSLRSSSGLAKTVASRYSKMGGALIGAQQTANKFSRGLKPLKVNLLAVAGTAVKVAAAFTAIGVAVAGTFTKSSIDAANEYEQAILGLTTVAEAFGVSSNDMKTALEDVTADGLVPLEDAATSLKNLIGTGLDLEQAINLFNTLKDSASANRKSSLTLGQQISTTTEGIKNQNSVLTDNSGITKNLSVIYKEYAASIGTTIGKLTDAQKTQAAYSGFMREGTVFAGAAAKALETYGGAATVAKKQFSDLQRTFGSLFTQNTNFIALTKFFGRIPADLTKMIKASDSFKDSVNTLIRSLVKLSIVGVKAVALLTKAMSRQAESLDAVIKGYKIWAKQIRAAGKELGLFAAKGVNKINKGLLSVTNSLAEALGGKANKRAEEKFNRTTRNIAKDLKKLEDDFQNARIAIATEDTGVKAAANIGDKVSEALVKSVDEFEKAYNKLDLKSTPTITPKTTGKPAKPKDLTPGEEARRKEQRLQEKRDREFNQSMSNAVSAFERFNQAADASQATQDQIDAAEKNKEEIVKQLKANASRRARATTTSQRSSLDAERKQLMDDQIANEKRLQELRAESQKQTDAAFATGVGIAASVYFGPVIGQAAEAFLTILADPDAFLAFQDRLIETAPEFVLRLIENLPKLFIGTHKAIINTIISVWTNGIKVVASRWAEELTKIFGSGAITKFFDSLSQGFKNIFNGVLTDGAKQFVDKIVELIGKANPFGRGKGPSAYGVGLEDVLSGGLTRLATGGQVTGAGNRDTVPALLTPGEVVVDRTTGPRLMDFIDSQEKPKAQDNSGVEALLVQLLEQNRGGASQAPITVQLTMDGSVLEEKILELNNNNARLA